MGMNGHKHTEEAKQRMKENHVGMKGKYHSEETRRKMSKTKMGKPSPRKGKTLTVETREKISKARKGKPSSLKGKNLSQETRKKISEAHKGKIQTIETCKKISETKKGKPPPNKGKSPSLETRKKLSEAVKGEKSCLWKGGISKENALIRSEIEFRLWREAIFARDNWTCQKCERRGTGIYLHAHHIKPFAKFPEFRFALDNGITFCKECHRSLHFKKKGDK